MGGLTQQPPDQESHALGTEPVKHPDLNAVLKLYTHYYNTVHFYRDPEKM